MAAKVLLEKKKKKTRIETRIGMLENWKLNDYFLSLFNKFDALKSNRVNKLNYSRAIIMKSNFTTYFNTLQLTMKPHKFTTNYQLYSTP